MHIAVDDDGWTACCCYKKTLEMVQTMFQRSAKEAIVNSKEEGYYCDATVSSTSLQWLVLFEIH